MTPGKRYRVRYKAPRTIRADKLLARARARALRRLHWEDNDLGNMDESMIGEAERLEDSLAMIAGYELKRYHEQY